MPIYEYGCDDCGPFTMLRPMADYATPQQCPECGVAAPRVMLTVPSIAGMSSSRRAAFATNERSAHEPRLASATGAHRPGCGCCAPAKRADRPAAAKGFPAQRPWMISH
jgi:putative FmdB family regulatory protein